MECLYDAHWCTSVKENICSGETSLIAETLFNDTDREMLASLKVDKNSFVIQEGVWEIQRPIGKIEKRVINSLKGLEAYFNSGPALRKSLQDMKEPLAYSLFSESVKGIIQSESFLYEERGFKSDEDYSKYWQDFYLDSCRYYSNLDRVQQEWFDHVGVKTREGSLFVRFKNQTLYKLDNNYLLQANFSDSFHQVNISLNLNQEDMNITDVSAVLRRCPDSVCKESTKFCDNLINKNLTSLEKKEVAILLGKNQGCVHLIDLINDAAQILKYFKEREKNG